MYASAPEMPESNAMIDRIFVGMRKRPSKDMKLRLRLRQSKQENSTLEADNLKIYLKLYVSFAPYFSGWSASPASA
jgi:hypothetical protein